MTELENFFAKKASKSKKNVLSVGLLEERLNQAMVNQAETKQDLVANSDPNSIVFCEGDAPDSEWLDPSEAAAMNFEEIGIKDMTLSGDADQDMSDNETETMNDVPKTWKTEQENDEEILMPPTKSSVRTKYVPPTVARLRPQNVQLDLKNEEMFPSLDMAEQKEKEIKKTLAKALKSEGGWTVQGPNKSAAKSMQNPNVYLPPQLRLPASQSAWPKDETGLKSEPIVEKKNKYVPPALRQ